MDYEFDQIFTKNDDLLNRLIAEYVMKEPEPDYHHDIRNGHPAFSNGGWWMCIPQVDEDCCKWSPVNFSSSLKWTWKVVKAIHETFDRTVREDFRYFMETYSPMDSETEAECCRKICRSALLAIKKKTHKINS